MSDALAMNRTTNQTGVPARLPSTSRTALKEWAVACQALGRGEQILLLRKGGISEAHKEFRIEQPEFLLFPTYEHQRADLIKEHARASLDSVQAGRGRSDQVTISFWVRVAGEFEITAAEQLEAVAPLHLWSEDYALERLRWRPRKPLHLLALRVYRLPEPVTLPILAEYGGCTSWLALSQPVAVEGARPVLDDSDFGRQLEQVRQALDGMPREVRTA